MNADRGNSFANGDSAGGPGDGQRSRWTWAGGYQATLRPVTLYDLIEPGCYS